MAYSRKFLTVAALGVASLALIGVGANATFTDSVDASRDVTAGKMDLVITNGAGGTVSPDGKSVTLPDFGPTGSTFETTHRVITVTNNGDIPVKSLAFQMGGTRGTSQASYTLWNQVNVCIKSTDKSGTWTEGNGPLTTAVALTPTVAQNPVDLVPGQSMTFSVDFYAGKDSTNCEAKYSDGPNTNNAWYSHSGGAYQTPASLTNAAMGGVVTPKLTFSFTG
jgi:predicted ribosomally synthesized peptide with SipW-like signal peptide